MSGKAAKKAADVEEVRANMRIVPQKKKASSKLEKEIFSNDSGDDTCDCNSSDDEGV